MSYLPKPHGYLVDFFKKNEEQTNMNITFNKSPIPAAGKEKLTPAEEGPGCQEGHGTSAVNAGRSPSVLAMYTKQSAA